MDALPVDNDLADAVRRLGLLQEEINHLNALAAMHNEQINKHHRDLHEAAKLIGDIHATVSLPRGELRDRTAAHVAKHGHPQDVPESPES